MSIWMFMAIGLVVVVVMILLSGAGAPGGRSRPPATQPIPDHITARAPISRVDAARVTDPAETVSGTSNSCRPLRHPPRCIESER